MSRNGQKVVPGNGTKRGRLQIFAVGFAVEGGDDVLSEGFKAIKDFTEVLKGSGLTPLPGAKGVLAAGADPGKQTAAAGVEAPEQDEVEQEDTVVEASNGSGADVPKPRRNVPRTPSVLNDIDFNSGAVTLKDLVAQKNPNDNYERYAVIAVWYKDYAKMEEINDDRIYTAYKFLDWVPPNNVAQVLRDLKASKKWFEKGSSKGMYKINIIGLNKVQEGFKK